MTLMVSIFDRIPYYRRPVCRVVFWTNHPLCALGGTLLLKKLSEIALYVCGRPCF